MSLHPNSSQTIPHQTLKVAKAAFPKGNNLYLKMPGELGTFFVDEQFAELFPTRGQSA